MSSKRSGGVAGHSLATWPNQIRWTGTKNVITALRGFGCECGLDFATDDPYGEYEVHLLNVTSALARRRWTEFFTKPTPTGKEAS